MKDSVFTIPTSSLLIEAVKIIEDMHLKDQNKDSKGDLYEYLLAALKTAGINGQFRTPRHIIRMIVSLVDPKIGDKICDPACGTAGFLISSYDHILRENTSEDFIYVDDLGVEHGFKGEKLNQNQWKVLNENTLYGYDFDSTMVRLSLMNLIMHGVNSPNIKQKNTLSSQYNQEKNHFDIVLANPPFKGSINKRELSNEFSITTTKTEILFLELMSNILSSGGRCGVIVPEGVLFSSSNAHKRIRQKLLEECRLDAVVSMPSGVFRPYAGVSTAVLIFTKGEPTKKVWFYKMKADGFSLDDKRTFIDGKGEIPDIITKFKQRETEKFEDRKANCFFVDFEEIKANNYDLSVSNYKETEYEQIEYEDPTEIKKKILELEEKIIHTLKELPT
jgi:type I restriction enzyme M protein